MSKYIDAEIIKTEIERQIQNLRGIAVDNPMLAQTMRLSFEGLLSFIASRQQEATAIAYLTEIHLTPANSRRAILELPNPPRTWEPGAQILCINDSIQEQPEVDEAEYGPYARQYPKTRKEE
jgi:hypothetical protein